MDFWDLLTEFDVDDQAKRVGTNMLSMPHKNSGGDLEEFINSSEVKKSIGVKEDFERDLTKEKILVETV